MADFDFSTLTAEECVALKGQLDDRLKELQGDITGYPSIEQVANVLTSIKENWATFLQGYGVSASADNPISKDWVDKFKNLLNIYIGDRTKITELTDPSITRIGMFGLYGCQELKKIDLPNCEYIGYQAFGDNRGSIEEVNLPKLKYLTRDNSNVYTGKGIFQTEYGNPKFTKLNFPELIGLANETLCELPSLVYFTANKLTQVGDTVSSTSRLVGAFQNDTALKEVTISIEKDCNICVNAFYSCKALEKITAKIVRIYASAFYDCIRLSNIDLSECIVIEDSAFRLAGLKTINALKLTKLGNSVFSQTQHNMGIETANFPECTSIGTGVFYQNENLTTANLPKITGILPTQTFRNCILLTEVNIPLVTGFGVEAFAFCENLESVDFSNIISLNDKVFYGCKKLTEFDFPNITSITGTPFYDVRADVKYIKLPNLTTHSAYIVNSTNVEYMILGLQAHSTTLFTGANYSLKKLYLPNFNGQNTAILVNTPNFEQLIIGNELVTLREPYIRYAKKVKIGNKVTALTLALGSSTSTYRTQISLDFANLQSITPTNTFRYMSRLRALILRGATKVSFSSTYSNQFSECYFMLGTYNATYNPNTEKGYFYVQDALVEEYKADSFFAGHEDQIKPLSELPSEYDITGEYIEGEFDEEATE